MLFRSIDRKKPRLDFFAIKCVRTQAKNPSEKVRSDYKFRVETRTALEDPELFDSMVETMGIEPTTSALRTLRSPN